ncbi:hypothetical protein [Kitasatospora kazusensis]|uniref:hypothetical protein n=1 Tax=Kitasatospora kazusensis TaxID=407974 RepID=UPI0031DFF8E1
MAWVDQEGTGRHRRPRGEAAPEVPPARYQHRKPRLEELPSLPVVEVRVRPEEVEEREPAPVVSLSGYRQRRGRRRVGTT